MPDLPARFAALIISFAPLFVQRSWLHAQVLLTGAILAPGRRTVASVLRITGHARDRHFTNYHRVLSRAPWSARGGARILLAHLIRAFAPRGPVVVGLDDTIERRWGPKIAARGIYRDPVRSSHGHFRACLTLMGWDRVVVCNGGDDVDCRGSRSIQGRWSALSERPDGRRMGHGAADDDPCTGR